MFFKKSTPTQQSVTKKTQPNFEEKWDYINQGLQKLFEFVGSDMKTLFDNTEYSKLYTAVYDLCTSKVDTGKLTAGATEILYERYAKAINKYLLDVIVPSLKQKQGDNLLMEGVKRWRDHNLVVRWMQKLFTYLDRYYTKHNNRDSLRDVGLKCFLDHVYGSVKKDMSTALLSKILAERNGDIIDKAVMKDGVQLFIDMGLNTLKAYEEDFEQNLLYQTSAFYKREAAHWISEDSCPGYMKKAEDRLLQEHARAKLYLHANTEPGLIKKAEAELITTHHQRLLEMEGSGLLKLLEDFKTEDLGRMYRLFKRVNLLKAMADLTRTFIQAEGHKILLTHQEKEELDFTTFIEDLLVLHEKYSQLISEWFDKDALFLEAMKDAFTNFVNTDLENKKKKSKTSTAELLSTYADSIMKNTEKVGDDLETVLEKIVRLFGYIGDKDMFNEFYRRQLSKRLLVAKTNNDAEKSFIAKLKVRCGASFTSKLEGMIKDKNLSADLQGSFKEYVTAKKIKLEIDFTPTVLTTGFWPAFKIDQLNVTNDFDNCMKCFKEFYDARTQSRSLKWVHSLGTCQVLAHYNAGDKDFTMSTYQASILGLFNQTQEITLADIQKTLNLPLDDVKKNVLSFCAKKDLMILKKSGDKTFQGTDLFSVNVEFESKSRRINVPNIVMKISEKEVEEIDKTLQEDRKHSIEATVVRIMKARKQMGHQQLVLEVSKQLLQHWKPDPKEIKRRIEDLITREYLERDESVANAYKYLA
jgi:cullin 1